jgi:hypothetical protein
MSEEETTESDALADSDIDAPPPRQRRRHSPSENGSFDAAKSEGGNFDADIDNHLPSAAADLAEMIEFMKMPLGSISASASSQQPEQGAVAQADGLGAIDASQSVTPGASEGSELVDDTDEEVSEVSLGSSEDEGTYSYQATGNSNLCLIADIQSESSGAMDGDSPATYTGIHGENNCGEIDPNVVLDSGHAAHGTSTWNLPSAEGPFDFGDGYEGHSILAEEGECSQQRPNYFSSRTVSNYSSLSGVFGDTELPSQYDEEMFSTAEPIDTSFSGNPDNADYQQYPTSSNFDAPSSRNGGQDSVNYEYHQSYTDAVEELCTFLALSRLSLSDAGSGQNWTPSPSSANPDISHLAADARETEFVQRSDNLPSEMQVNEEVERCVYSPQIISFFQADNVPAVAMNSEVVSTVDDDANDSEAAMAEDMDTVTDHNAAAVYPEVDWTAATQVPPMAEHTPLLNLAMDIGPEIIAMGEDWSTDLAATLSRDDRPSQFLVPYAWLLPSAMRVSQGLTDEDDLDGSDQPMPMAEVS